MEAEVFELDPLPTSSFVQLPIDLSLILSFLKRPSLQQRSKWRIVLLISIRNSKQVKCLGTAHGATMLCIHGKNKPMAVRGRSEALKQGGSDNNLKLADFSDSPFSTHFKLDNHQVGYDNSVRASSAGKMGLWLSMPEAASTMQWQWCWWSFPLCKSELDLWCN